MTYNVIKKQSNLILKLQLNVYLSFFEYLITFRSKSKTSAYSERFLGFSIYISNTTNRTDGSLCFKNNIYTRSTIANPFTVNCRRHGRYVIYYNNRTNNPFPNGVSKDGAYNELCEFDIFGTFLLLQSICLIL